MKQIKCVWCGQTLPLTKTGQRPKQHHNGATLCPGSGQLVTTHINQAELIKLARRFA